MNDLFNINQATGTEGLNKKMDINNLSNIEEKVILIKEFFEKTRKEKNRLLEEIKARDEEIKELKNKLSLNEAENDIIVKKIESIMANLESIKV